MEIPSMQLANEEKAQSATLEEGIPETISNQMMATLHQSYEV